jgi:hypothetical protein
MWMSPMQLKISLIIGNILFMQYNVGWTVILKITSSLTAKSIKFLYCVREHNIWTRKQSPHSVLGKEKRWFLYCPFGCVSRHFWVSTLWLYSASHSRVAPENVGLQKERKYNTFACHTSNEVRLCVLGIRKKEVGNMKRLDKISFFTKSWMHRFDDGFRPSNWSTNLFWQFLMEPVIQ